MKIIEDVRKYAAEHGIAEEETLRRGMESKSKDFVGRGAELYAKASSVAQATHPPSQSEDDLSSVCVGCDLNQNEHDNWTYFVRFAFWNREVALAPGVLGSHNSIHFRIRLLKQKQAGIQPGGLI